MPLSLAAIPVLDTNYVWVLHDADTALIVDPGSAEEPLAWLEDHELALRAILITHHHWDHTNGLDEILAHHPVPVWGPHDDRIPQVDHPVGEGDQARVPELGLAFEVLEVPGHTTTHIVFHDDEFLLSGDTLFSVGCGRLFEGTPEQMLASLDKIAALSGALKVCCGHEYTVDNCRFALEVEPENEQLRSRAEEARRLRAAERITLPSRLQEELAVNPFLRARKKNVTEAANQYEPGTGNDPAAVFGVIRRWKDRF